MSSHHEGPPGMTEAALEHLHKGAKELVRILISVPSLIFGWLHHMLDIPHPSKPEPTGHGGH